MEEKIHSLLRQLGITDNYKGFLQLTRAVMLARQDAKRLLEIDRRIYREVAGDFDTSWQAVERNIRWVLHKAWRSNPQGLAALAHRKIENRPTASQFIAMLAGAL